MLQEANQRQGEKVVRELTQMPQTPVDRPLHALIEIQERHPEHGTMEDVPTRPTKNRTHSTASPSKKDRQSELTDLPEVPQGGRDGRALPHRMRGIRNPKRTHGKTAAEGREIHQHTTHEPESLRTPVQIHTRNGEVSQDTSRKLDLHNPTLAYVGSHAPCLRTRSVRRDREIN